MDGIKKIVDNDMSFEIQKAICPYCNYTVFPKFTKYSYSADSFLRWCPHCYKAKAIIFWRYIENI